MSDRTELHFIGGGSDKVYIAEILESAPNSGMYVVECQYGRRGSTLNHARKTPSPVSYWAAKRIYDKVVAEKTGKGYNIVSLTQGSAKTQATSQPNPAPAQAPEFLPQLLNPVADEAELEGLLSGVAWLMQEKMDGVRKLAVCENNAWHGLNKKGMRVELPQAILDDLSAGFPNNTILDGEQIGDKLYVFDVLSLGGLDLTKLGFAERYRQLAAHIKNRELSAIVLVPVFRKTGGKRKAIEDFRKANAEGVVFKHFDAPYEPGRPNSGGKQRKYKFVESATLVVMGARKGKRSVELGGYDDAGNLVSVGNVTIPPNHEVPSQGAICEARYLYAYRGGALYQPVYLGVREDQDLNDCVLSQLKYKNVLDDLADAAPEKDARWAW